MFKHLNGFYNRKGFPGKHFFLLLPYLLIVARTSNNQISHFLMRSTKTS